MLEADSPLKKSKAVQRTGMECPVTFGDILCGDLFAERCQYPYTTLENGLSSGLHKSTGILLRFCDYTLAIAAHPHGQFIMFDSHARNTEGFIDSNGVAQVKCFPSLKSIAHYVRLFVRHSGVESNPSKSINQITLQERSFEILPVQIDTFKVLHIT